MPFSARSSCRLTTEEHESMLDGSPGDLRSLANVLDLPHDTVVVELSSGPGAQVRREHTTLDRLRISLRPGPVLVVEGTASAVTFLTEAMRGVADAADEIGHAVIRRHAHIEYLGPDDQWRSPDSFPLIVGSDWPSAGGP